MEYMMKDKYKTSRLYVANLGIINDSSVGVPNFKGKNLKYLFERLETNRGVKYVELFKGYTIYENNGMGFYHDLPYLENITPLKEVMPYINNTVELKDLLLIMKAVNAKDTSHNMIYIDFDGVILDTEEELFREWRKNPNRHLLPEKTKIDYIANADWDSILHNSKPLNNSLHYLSEMDDKSVILTKIHSLAEGTAKINWIKENGIKQNVTLVPYNVKKSDVVDAKGNILIDDCIKNLDEWEEKGGTGILFDANDDNYDSWNKPNIKPYRRVLTLSNIKK